MLIEPVGIHHAGVIVSDLRAAIDFYRGIFGAEVELELASVGGDHLAAMFNVEDIALDLAFLTFPNSRIELIQIHRPAGRSKRVPRPTDLGAGHICVQVDDLKRFA